MFVSCWLNTTVQCHWPGKNRTVVSNCCVSRHRWLFPLAFLNAMRIALNRCSIINKEFHSNITFHVGPLKSIISLMVVSFSSGIKDIQIVTGQGVIKKVQLAHSSLGPHLPSSSLDTSTSQCYDFLQLHVNARSSVSVHFSACRDVCRSSATSATILTRCSRFAQASRAPLPFARIEIRLGLSSVLQSAMPGSWLRFLESDRSSNGDSQIATSNYQLLSVGVTFGFLHS